MEELEKVLGPRNEEEREVFAIERAVFAADMAIHGAMKEGGVTQEELAERLGRWAVKARSGMTIWELALAMHALGGELVIGFRR